ncbi:MAG: efflux RND transporter periplasmic adaptor subunit [Phycisphaerae bacterium]|nr:efflux RND transporter periplasmic adaptor subunit [Phycisphaerae bacterium]
MADNNGKSNQGKSGPRRRGVLRLMGRKGFWAVLILTAVVLIIVLLKVVRGVEDPTSGLATFVAKRGPLTISIPESGTIKAREKIIIKNEIEGRTSIVSLIPEGTHVKKGDLLIELDASALEDSKIDQEIAVQKAFAAFIDANETLAVVQNQSISDVNVAQLTLEFAIQDLDQYIKGKYPNEETTANNDITLREEELKRAEETLTWSQKLYEKKYISQTELMADKLAVTRSKNNLELAQNNLGLLEDFTYHRNIAQFRSDVTQAEMALERTERKSRAQVIQAEADLKAKELEYKRQLDKFDKIEDQLKKAKIYSPVDAMVIYATTASRGGFRDRRDPMDIGVELTERQELFHLPTAQSAMVEVDIHEASLEKVRLGLPVVVTVDALPGQKFFGSVQRIAPLPDPQSMWMNPDLKVYNSDVYLEGNIPSLRTGMSCKVDIIVEQYKDAVYVPVTTVLRVGGESTVFVVKDGSIEERKVKVGLDNRRMIRIISGLDEGEVVSMTPPLKSAAIDSGSGIVGGLSGTGDELKERINEKLEETNGAEVRRPPSVPSEGVEGPQRGIGPGGVGPGQGPAGREGLESLTPEQREQMRKRFENMTPEEREKMRQRQGTGRRQGRGEGSRQGGGPRTQGSGRD